MSGRDPRAKKTNERVNEKIIAPALDEGQDEAAEEKHREDELEEFRCQPCEDLPGMEEAAALKHAPSPVMPSQAEIEEHRVTQSTRYRE